MLLPQKINKLILLIYDLNPAFVSVVGNVLVILSVFLSKSLYKVSNVFVVSLAVWDLCQNVLLKPLYVHTYMSGSWQFGPHVCLFALFASNLAILESILHVAAIAFHRYVILVHPRCAGQFQRARSILLLLLAIYTLPLLLVLLPSVHRLIDPDLEHQVIFNTRIMFCSFVRHSEFRLGSVIKKVVFVTLAATFLFYCYLRIYVVVRRSGQSVNVHAAMFSPTRIRREWTLLKTILSCWVQR